MWKYFSTKHDLQWMEKRLQSEKCILICSQTCFDSMCNQRASKHALGNYFEDEINIHTTEKSFCVHGCESAW